jgi:hypothetical protein
MVAFDSERIAWALELGRKAMTPRAFIDGQLNAAMIKQRLRIDYDELLGWLDRYVRYGKKGLRITNVQRYREPSIRSEKPRHKAGSRKPRARA